MRVDVFDFELPEDRIALRPATPRDSARMLVVNPERDCSLRDAAVRDLPDFLRPGDAMVFNRTQVIPAQLYGIRQRGDFEASISFTLNKRLDASRWTAFAKPAKRLRSGDVIVFKNKEIYGDFGASVEGFSGAGMVVLAFDRQGPSLEKAIADCGHTPLPPYIASRRRDDIRDRSDYQTIYADEPGAVAAPTAGLHFTCDLMAAIDQRGIDRHYVTLHVGAGTFLPVKSEDTTDHQMHSEFGVIDRTTADALNTVRANGGRIIAVGTTSLRLLESAADPGGRIHPFSGDTDIFITPGYRFRVVDVLMTNFHLPRSTLFMLVAAFSGLECMHRAYRHAVDESYRFYSYGDASLLFRSAETSGQS